MCGRAHGRAVNLHARIDRHCTPVIPVPRRYRRPASTAVVSTDTARFARLAAPVSTALVSTDTARFARLAAPVSTTSVSIRLSATPVRTQKQPPARDERPRNERMESVSLSNTRSNRKPDLPLEQHKSFYFLRCCSFFFWQSPLLLCLNPSELFRRCVCFFANKLSGRKRTERSLFIFTPTLGRAPEIHLSFLRSYRSA